MDDLLPRMNILTFLCSLLFCFFYPLYRDFSENMCFFCLMETAITYFFYPLCAFRYELLEQI